MEPTIEPAAEPSTIEPAAEPTIEPAAELSTADPVRAASARAWITARWGGLRGPERVVLVGASLATIGAIVVTGTANRNANGAASTAAVIVVLAVVGVGFVPVLRRRPDVVGVLVGWSSALTALAVLDLIHPIRYSGDLDVFGGAAGAVGRGLTVVGAGMLLAGVVALRRGLALPPRTAEPRLTPIRVLLGGGAALLVLAWFVLLALADGFAMRAIDAIAVASACLALPVADLTRRLAVPARWSDMVATGSPAALASLAALIIFDGVLVVVGRIGELTGSGLVNVAGVALYLLAGFTLVGAVIVFLISLIRPEPGIASNIPNGA